MKQCPNENCIVINNNQDSKAEYCTECGTKLIKYFCKKCAYNLSLLDKFCPSCGEKAEGCIYNNKTLFNGNLIKEKS